MWEARTGSQNHRIVDIESDLWKLASPSRFSTESYTGKHPGSFWVSREKETSPPHCAACSANLSPSK